MKVTTNSETKRKKRANGEGTIRKLKDGRWEARITNGYNEKGKQHFVTHSSKKQSDVIKWLNEYKANHKKFEQSNAVKYTVREWLDIWLDTYVKNNVKTSTRVSYEGIVKNHINTHIGHIKLVELKKVHIEKMYNDLVKER